MADIVHAKFIIAGKFSKKIIKLKPGVSLTCCMFFGVLIY